MEIRTDGQTMGKQCTPYKHRGGGYKMSFQIAESKIFSVIVKDIRIKAYNEVKTH